MSRTFSEYYPNFILNLCFVNEITLRSHFPGYCSNECWEIDKRRAGGDNPHLKDKRRSGGKCLPPEKPANYGKPGCECKVCKNNVGNPNADPYDHPEYKGQ